MASVVVLEERLEIPGGIDSLAAFRRWALSDVFPRTGRIDYLAGRIEVDMSPEDFFCHGVLTVELVRTLAEKVKQGDLGFVVSDRTRISCPAADLSAEPDVVFLSHAALAAGRARLVPASEAGSDHFVEVEGAPDLIVEVVSRSSQTKDTRRLPAAYFAAGVREFWLVDARRELVFQIHRRGAQGYEPADVDADGFQASDVFGCAFRLDRRGDNRGHWTFDLRERASS